VWSYSFYLSHKAVAHIIGNIATQRNWGEATTIGVILASSLALAAALYVTIERPFMQLRDRLLPGNFKAATL
jgi:peptidoglycan/LPS O-acetylase OafA/YrhL